MLTSELILKVGRQGEGMTVYPAFPLQTALWGMCMDMRARTHMCMHHGACLESRGQCCRVSPLSTLTWDLQINLRSLGLRSRQPVPSLLSHLTSPEELHCREVFQLTYEKQRWRMKKLLFILFYEWNYVGVLASGNKTDKYYRLIDDHGILNCT